MVSGQAVPYIASASGYLPVDIQRVDGVELVSNHASGSIPADVRYIENSDASQYFDTVATVVNQNTNAVGNSINANINDGVPISGTVNANLMTVEGGDASEFFANNVTIPVQVSVDTVNTHLIQIEANINDGISANVTMIKGTDADVYFNALANGLHVQLNEIAGVLAAVQAGVNVVRFEGTDASLFLVDTVVTPLQELLDEVQATVDRMLSADTPVDGVPLLTLLSNLKAHAVGNYRIVDLGGGNKRVEFLKGDGVTVAFSCEVSLNSRTRVV